MNNLDITVREGDFEIYKDLYTTNLLNFVANQERRYRIRNIHYKWAIYPPRLEGFIPDQNDFHRNKLLNECETAGKINIYSEQKIPNCNMLKGWGIYFNYLFGDKTYYFVYLYDNKVYAMEEKWSSFKTRNASTPNASKEYYCKDVGINPCVTDFCNLLEDIIKMQE